jgi:hypothetical protein
VDQIPQFRIVVIADARQDSRAMFATGPIAAMANRAVPLKLGASWVRSLSEKDLAGNKENRKTKTWHTV